RRCQENARRNRRRLDVSERQLGRADDAALRCAWCPAAARGHDIGDRLAVTSERRQHASEERHQESPALHLTPRSSCVRLASRASSAKLETCEGFTWSGRMTALGL